MEEVDELESNITQATDEFKIVRGNLSEKQIAVYYASLAYNDKNIKELLKTMQKVNEGFASGEKEEVLDFTPPKLPSTDMNREPHIRIPKLAERLQKLETEVAIVNKAMRVFTNTAKQQQKTVKQIKLVANDEGEQKRQLDKQASKQAAKTAAASTGGAAMPPG
jgi:TolA-binding protein